MGLGLDMPSSQQFFLSRGQSWGAIEVNELVQLYLGSGRYTAEKSSHDVLKQRHQKQDKYAFLPENVSIGYSISQQSRRIQLQKKSGYQFVLQEKQQRKMWLGASHIRCGSRKGN